MFSLIQTVLFSWQLTLISMKHNLRTDAHTPPTEILFRNQTQISPLPLPISPNEMFVTEKCTPNHKFKKRLKVSWDKFRCSFSSVPVSYGSGTGTAFRARRGSTSGVLWHADKLAIARLTCCSRGCSQVTVPVGFPSTSRLEFSEHVPPIPIIWKFQT